MSLCSGLGASGWRGVLPTAQSRRETGRKHTGLPTCPIQAPGLSPAIRVGPCSWQDDSGSGAQPRPGGGLHPALRGRLRGRAGASRSHRQRGGGLPCIASAACSAGHVKVASHRDGPSCVHEQACAEWVTGSALRGRGRVSLQRQTPQLFWGVCISATPTSTDTTSSRPLNPKSPEGGGLLSSHLAGMKTLFSQDRPSPWQGHSSLGPWAQWSGAARGKRGWHPYLQVDEDGRHVRGAQHQPQGDHVVLEERARCCRLSLEGSATFQARGAPMASPRWGAPCGPVTQAQHPPVLSAQWRASWGDLGPAHCGMGGARPERQSGPYTHHVVRAPRGHSAWCWT